MILSDGMNDKHTRDLVGMNDKQTYQGFSLGAALGCVQLTPKINKAAQNHDFCAFQAKDEKCKLVLQLVLAKDLVGFSKKKRRKQLKYVVGQTRPVCNIRKKFSPEKLKKNFSNSFNKQKRALPKTPVMVDDKTIFLSLKLLLY